MASNVPVVRQISWLSVIPQIIVIGSLIFLYDLADFGDPFLLAVFTYLILAFGLRYFIATNHSRGMTLTKKQRFEEAIPWFEKSVDYFDKNHWIDKYRFFTLLSSSKMTYKEMGLCNLAFCYSQTGNPQKVKEYYEQVLKEFPENGLAVAGLNFLKSAISS